MTLLPLPLRRRLDFYRMGARHRWRYLGAQAGLAFGLVGLVLTPVGLNWGWLVAVVSLIASIVLFVPDWNQARRGTVQLLRTHPPVELDKLDIGTRQYVRWARDVAVVDAMVDAALPTSRATVAWRRERPVLPASVRPYAFDTLRQRVTAPNVFNGKTVRQDDDLSALVLEQDGSVPFSATNYFALLMTNYMMDITIRDRASGRCVQQPLQLIDDGTGHLRGLAGSALANSVGVSTLAITADGKAIVVLQSGNTESSQGELAPSGSGSLDLRDVVKVRSGKATEQLISVVRSGMERELCEEAHLRPGEIEWTEVLGYYRWMNKGAKPEYTGVTKLTRTSAELRSRRVSFAEVPYVADLRFDAEIDFSALMADAEDPQALHVPDLPGRVSFPLYMCLRSLGLAMRSTDALARRLARLAQAS
jgi:hypothetical protein